MGYLSLRNLALFGLALQALVACSKGFDAYHPANDSKELQTRTDLTGAQLKDGRGHTTASNDGELTRLKVELKDTAENRKFARSLSVSSFEFKYDEKQPSQPTSVNITVDLKTEAAQTNEHATEKFNEKSNEKSSEKSAPTSTPSLPAHLPTKSVENFLKFHLELKKAKSGEVITTPTSAEHFPEYSLSGTCDSNNCSRLSLILTKTPSSSTDTAPINTLQAGVILRRQTAQVEIRGGLGSPQLEHDPLFQALQQNLQKLQLASLYSAEIAWGRSEFRVLLTNPVAEISGRLLETNQFDEPLTISGGNAGSSTELKAKLIGNSNDGGLLIEIRAGRSSILLSAVALDPNSSDEAKEIDVLKPPMNPVLPPEPVSTGTATPTPAPSPVTGPATPPTANPNANKNATTPPTTQPNSAPATLAQYIDRAHPVTLLFERNRYVPELRSYIDHWANSSRTTAFLRHLTPMLKETAGALKKAGAPIEMIFITMIESNFFVEDGYPIEISTSGALGPWQFTHGTGKGYGLNVRPASRHSGFNSCDERADFFLSTMAAGKYFADLFSYFPKDPELAVLGYTWGENKVGTALRCLKDSSCLQDKMASSAEVDRLQQIRTAGLSFWLVKKFNMAPAGDLEYVSNFLAAQFVGRNPEMYGLKTDDTPVPKYEGPHCSTMQYLFPQM